MVIQVDVVAELIRCVSVHTTLKAILAIAAYHCTTTSHGAMEKPAMPIHARCATAMDMLIPVTTMPQWTRSQRAMIREEVECVMTAKGILVC